MRESLIITVNILCDCLLGRLGAWQRPPNYSWTCSFDNNLRSVSIYTHIFNICFSGVSPSALFHFQCINIMENSWLDMGKKLVQWIATSQRAGRPCSSAGPGIDTFQWKRNRNHPVKYVQSGHRSTGNSAFRVSGPPWWWCSPSIYRKKTILRNPERSDFQRQKGKFPF